MVEKIELKQYNICLLNFEDLFYKKIETDLTDNLHKYLLLKNRINSQARKFFFHHIIFEICEFLLNQKNKEKNIIFFNYRQINTNYGLLKYFSEEDILKNLHGVLLKIKNLLPVRIFISKYTFEYFKHLNERNDGKAIETINNLKYYINNTEYENYTFSRIKKFTLKNDLTFLNQKYFNLLKTKQLLIS